MTTYQFTKGFNIKYKTNIPTSDIAKADLFIKTPKGNVLQRELALINDTDLLYSTNEDDLKHTGIYKLQVKIIQKDESVFYTSETDLVVKKTLE